MANLYNSEGYFSPTEYEAFTRIEKDERAARIAANYRPLVYICSPYAGDTEHNTENAKKYSRFALEQHCIPLEAVGKFFCGDKKLIEYVQMICGLCRML